MANMELNMNEKTMYQRLKEAALEKPNYAAIYYQGKKISFRKFLKMVDRMANILQYRSGVQENDVVLVAQPNIPDVLTLIYAVNKIGAIVNLVHPFIPFNQVKKIIKQTNTKVAFLFEQRIAKEVIKYRELNFPIYVTRVEDHLPLLKKFIYHTFMNFKIRRKLGKWRGSFGGFNYLKDLKPVRGKEVVECQDGSKMSVLLHSGSTTGDPKTICLADKNFNAVSDACFEIMCCEKDRFKKGGFLSVLPSFHGFGFCMTMHAPITNGFTIALMPKFNAKEVAKMMKKVNLTVICGVPTVFEHLLKCDEFVHSKHLKNCYVAYCGGDTISISLKKRFDETMKAGGSNCQVFEGYGLTEAIAVNCVNTYEHNKPGSIGYPVSFAEFAILDENGKEVPRGTIGEIAIKSKLTMIGYWNDPEATKATFKNGWLCTGDLGYMDGDGYIFFQQRKKRVVKVSGVAVFPTEVERLVETVPGVEAVCAIQIPDARLQHALKLFVVAKYFDEEGMRNQILDTCRKYLIKWSVPKEIEFVKELPLTLLNKVDFKKLQEQENAKRGIK